MTETVKGRLTSFAPQLLVDDLDRSIAYYKKIGFIFGEPWDGFYAIGLLDGLELHLKEAPKDPSERQHRRDSEHLDASAGVDGITGVADQLAEEDFFMGIERMNDDIENLFQFGFELKGFGIHDLEIGSNVSKCAAGAKRKLGKFSQE